MTIAKNTLKSIAEELDVSVSTISRVVNNHEYVKDETRQRVIEALRASNYVPNENARSLKTKTTRTIGIALPDISEVFFGTIVKKIDEVVSREGYTIVIVDTNESIANEQRNLQMLFQKRIDALVLATVDLDGKTIKPFIEDSTPIIFIDNIPRINAIDSVTIDNHKASVLAVNHLIQKGHEKIATIIGSKKETTGSERFQGYIDTLQKNNIAVDYNLIEYGNYKESTGYKCMINLLEKRSVVNFTAVYVTSEMMVFGAIKAIKEFGLKIPEDISLVGFDVHDKTGLVAPTITTLRQPEELIGIKVGELLIQKLSTNKDDKQKTGPQKIILEPYLITGESVKNIF